jgi:hypothetical protein
MTSDYWIGFPVTMITLPQTLMAGTDTLSVQFPADTDLSAVQAADVWVWSTFYAAWAQPAAITIVDQYLEFVVPIGFWPSLPAGDTIEIDVEDVVNPTVPGDYCLFLGYMDDCCDPVMFDCVEYTVSPAYIEYGFHFDFDKTFSGIAEDFIPPFKACGQDGYGVDIPLIGWHDVFDLILRDENGGCLPPCDLADMWFVLEECPLGETVSFIFDELGANLVFSLTETGDPLTTDVGVEQILPDVDLTLGPPPDVMWECKLHFSSPGQYKITFYLECPAVACGPGARTWTGEMPVTVHQWKDPGKLELFEKWNLVSLPIVPFDTSIASLLASLDPEALDGDGVDDLISIHHYDRPGCADPGTWQVYAADGSQTSLSTMEDGKSYWVRTTYPDAGNYPYEWWVFGTALPMPPASPKQYPVCAGWNMLGFTSLLDDEVDDYLWNWTVGTYVVYGWDNTGSWLTSGWEYIDATIPDFLETGQGYWAAFVGAGNVFVPGP